MQPRDEKQRDRLYSQARAVKAALLLLAEHPPKPTDLRTQQKGRVIR